MAAKDDKISIDESDSHNQDNCDSTPNSGRKSAHFPCDFFHHDGNDTIHVAVVYKTSSSACFTYSTTIPTRSTRTCPVAGASASASSSDSNGVFYIYATLNGLDTIAQSTHRIVESHCPWLLDELSEEQDVLVRYGDANRAQRRQQNMDQQPIINVYLSYYNSDIKNIISPAAITKNVLKCGMIVTFLYDYRLLMLPLAAAAAATRDEIDSEGFVSESYGKTNTNMNVTSLRSRDSLTQQQQITLAATPPQKKKSRKSSRERMALDDLEVLNKKLKRNSKLTLQLPAASAAQELMAHSSNPTDTLNLPSQLQRTPESALNRSSLPRAETLLHHRQQQPAIDPLKVAPIAAAQVHEKYSVTASAVCSTAICSKENKCRKSPSQRTITSSSQHPATASTSKDLVVTTTKLPAEWGTSSEVALEAKKQNSAEDKSSNKQKNKLNTPDDKERIGKGSSSTRVTNQPFYSTSESIHVPVPTPTEAAPTVGSNISDKFGTATSVVNSIIDVHRKSAVRSLNYKNQRNKSNTLVSSETTSLHSSDLLRPQKQTSSAVTRKSKKKSRKSSSEHEARNEAEVPKNKPKTSAGSSPIVHQSAAPSKFAVITEKRNNIADEPPKTEKKATKKISDTTTVTQPSPLVKAVNADIPDGNRKDKDVSYLQQKQPKIDLLKAAPTCVQANLVAAPPIGDSSATKERETCTPKDANSTTIAQPSPFVTVMNANMLDSHQKGKTFSFVLKQQPTSNPLKAVPITSSTISALSIIDSNLSSNKEDGTFSPRNIGTSEEGISMDSLTMLIKIQLKNLCKTNKIPHSGTKKNLIDRLMKNRNSSEGRDSTTSIVETSPVRIIVSNVNKKQHYERITTYTEADALKDVSLMSSGPTVNDLNVCSTTPQEALLLLNNQQQSKADKKRGSTKVINEKQLASQHNSPITTANDMVLFARQFDREIRPMKTTSTDSSKEIKSSGDCIKKLTQKVKPLKPVFLVKFDKSAVAVPVGYPQLSKCSFDSMAPLTASKLKYSDMDADPTPLSPFANDKDTPHPLAVIDEATYQKFKENTILFSNMQRFNVETSNPSDGGQTTFSIENCGENVRHIFKEMNGCRLFDGTCEIPFGYIFFMCRASEKCLVSDPSVVFIGDKHRKEDYVILFLFVSDIKLYSSMDDVPVWKNLEYLKQLKKGKKSTIKGNKGSHHYGSTGECFSFGARNSFNADPVFPDVSLTNYAGDNYETMIEFRKYIWQQFDAVFIAFDSILTGLSCKLNVGVKSMQLLSKNSVLDKYVRSAEELECGKTPLILTASINVDCRTRVPHCEKDITYTTIVVPIQENKSSNITFEFKVSNGALFQFCCSQSSCFTYSAYCLTHRQLSTNGTKCMNLSSYSNIRTYFHFRTSYVNIMNKK